MYVETSVIVDTVSIVADRFLAGESSGKLGRRVIYTQNISGYLVDKSKTWVNGKNTLETGLPCWSSG